MGEVNVKCKCGADTRKIVFEHEWCDKCGRAVDITGPRPFALYDPFRTGDLTAAHAADIKQRGIEKDGDSYKRINKKPPTIYPGGAFT